jgi:hypothetical protein
MSVTNLNRLAWLNGGLNNYIAKHKSLDKHHEKELTDTMIRFDSGGGSDISIKILLETERYLKVRIGLRSNGKLVCKLLFEKIHNNGAIWRFRDCERLWYVAFEMNKIIEFGDIFYEQVILEKEDGNLSIKSTR